MDAIYVGEFRTRIATGDKYIVRPGSPHFHLHITVKHVSRDSVTYDYAFPYADLPLQGQRTISPLDFADYFIWNACTEKTT